MRLGLISDIHADLRALERALDILENKGADRVVCAGDIVEKGPDGDRVVEALARSWVTCVRGNHDDSAIQRFHDRDDDPLDPLLGADSVAFLEALPAERSMVWEGVRITLGHIAPFGTIEPVLPEHFPKKLKRHLRDAEIDLLILGHTHRPTMVSHGDLWVVNPGSVAGSRARDSHSCALIELPSLSLSIFSLEDGSRLVPAGLIASAP